MTAADITPNALADVLREHDHVGRDAFLAAYGYGRATRYVLIHEGRFYDPKAVVGAAHIVSTGRRWDQLSGGEMTNTVLTAHGYTVRPLNEVYEGHPLGDLISVDDLDDYVLVPDGDPLVDPLVDDDGVHEGHRTLRHHVRIERNRTVIRAKKKAVMQSEGELRCEVCGLEPSELYGEVGSGLVDVHHIRPLHESWLTVTRLSDLAIVCPTCHRALHRHHPLPRPAELRRRLTKETDWPRGAHPAG